jgi:hypothetical protein
VAKGMETWKVLTDPKIAEPAIKKASPDFELPICSFCAPESRF